MRRTLRPGVVAQKQKKAHPRASVESVKRHTAIFFETSALVHKPLLLYCIAYSLNVSNGTGKKEITICEKRLGLSACASLGCEAPTFLSKGQPKAQAPQNFVRISKVRKYLYGSCAPSCSSGAFCGIQQSPTLPRSHPFRRPVLHER